MKFHANNILTNTHSFDSHARIRVAGVLARHAVYVYRYQDNSANADLSVSIYCKVHLGKGTSM